MTDISDSRASIPPALMLYDGLCGFCNWSVRWVIKRDRHDRFRFAALQSALAEAVLARHGVDAQATLAANTAYLVLGYDLPGEQLLCRSDVTVQVLRLLGGGWELVGTSSRRGAEISSRRRVYAGGADPVQDCGAV